MEFKISLLTIKEFNEHIKPQKTTTYEDLKTGIFKSQRNFIDSIINLPTKPLTEQINKLNIISNKKGGVILNSFIDTNLAFHLFKHNLINAYKHTYIKGEYNLYLTNKIYSLKSMYVFWESFIDKIALPYYEYFLSKEEKSKIKSHQIQRKIKKIWKEYENLIKDLKKNKFTFLKNQYSFNDFSNNTKHKRNKIDIFLMDILGELHYKKSIEETKLQELNTLFKSTYLTMLENIDLVNKFLRKEFITLNEYNLNNNNQQ